MISESQKLIVAANLLSGCINSPADLNLIGEEQISKSIDIAVRLIDKVNDENSFDITDNEKIIDIVSNAFDSIDSVSSQKEVLVETIQKKEKIGKDKALAVIQKAERIGLVTIKKVKGKNFYILLC